MYESKFYNNLTDIPQRLFLLQNLDQTNDCAEIISMSRTDYEDRRRYWVQPTTLSDLGPGKVILKISGFCLSS